MHCDQNLNCTLGITSFIELLAISYQRSALKRRLAGDHDGLQPGRSITALPMTSRSIDVDFGYAKEGGDIRLSTKLREEIRSQLRSLGHAQGVHGLKLEALAYKLKNRFHTYVFTIDADIARGRIHAHYEPGIHIPILSRHCLRGANQQAHCRGNYKQLVKFHFLFLSYVF
jgi:hypothetical protein